jgi:hypothetical protein
MLDGIGAYARSYARDRIPESVRSLVARARAAFPGLGPPGLRLWDDDCAVVELVRS